MKTDTTLTGDQVAWIKGALHRHAHSFQTNWPRISRAEACADLAFIIELCEIIGFDLDKDAKHNALPVEMREGFNGR